jgi:hypothetical protein
MRFLDVGRVLFLAMMAAVPLGARAQVGGATCETAGVITHSGTYSFDNTDAPQNNPCDEWGRTVWFRFTPTEPGHVYADTVGSEFDTYMHVFRGDCPVTCDDLYLEVDDTYGLQTSVLFYAEPETTYQIAIKGYDEVDFGEGVMNFLFSPAAEHGPADAFRCETAVNITEDGRYYFDTSDSDRLDPCFDFVVSTTFYKFVTPTHGYIQLSLCDNPFPARIGFYLGPDCPTECDNSLSYEYGYCSNNLETYFLPVYHGDVIYILASAYPSDDLGEGVFDFKFVPGEFGPGDDCISADTIRLSGSYDFDTTGASANDPCVQTSPTVWYRMLFPYNGEVTLETHGSIETVVRVYEDEFCEIDCDDLLHAYISSSEDGPLTFTVEANKSYAITIGGDTESDVGSGVLYVYFDREVPVEPTEIFESGVYPFDTTDAGSYDPCRPGRPGVWYRYTATETATVVASTCGSSFDTYLVVYESGEFPFECSRVINENDDFCDYQSSVTFHVEEGETYLISVHGYHESEYGPGTLDFLIIPELPIMSEVGGPTCAEAGIITGNGRYAYDTSTASLGHPCGDQNSRTSYFRFTAPERGLVHANLCDSNFKAALLVQESDTCPEGCGSEVLWNWEGCGTVAGGWFIADAGKTYYFSITGHSIEDIGDGFLNFHFTTLPPLPPEASPVCAEAPFLTQNGIYEYSTNGVPNNSDLCRQGSPTVYFKFAPNVNGELLLETCGLAGYDTFLSLYNGCPTIGCATRLEYNDDLCESQSQLTWSVIKGQTYIIGLSGYRDEVGNGALKFDFTPDLTPGDINGDGILNVVDVTRLGNLLAKGTPPSVESGDLNGDNQVTEADLEILAEMIVSGP